MQKFLAKLSTLLNYLKGNMAEDIRKKRKKVIPELFTQIN